MDKAFQIKPVVNCPEKRQVGSQQPGEVRLLTTRRRNALIVVSLLESQIIFDVQ